MPEAGYKWKPIEDLPNDLDVFRDRELEALRSAWKKQRETLSQEQALSRFNVQIVREWSIETGIIEGIYRLDRGTTETLIEHGINADLIPRSATDRDPTLVTAMIRAHEEVLEGLFAFVKTERRLTTGYIKELHAALLRHQETVTVVDQFDHVFESRLEKGAYKRLPNNPRREDGSIHEYCPPEQVASEMDRLIQLHEKHAERGVPAEVEATWLHHAFTQIHPFQDGNGRVARAIATLVLIRAADFPLVVADSEKPKYIEVLEHADRGDLRPFAVFVARLQKRLLTRAIGLAIDSRPALTVDQAVINTRDLLIDLGQIVPNEWLKAKENAKRLSSIAQVRLNHAAALVRNEISRLNPAFTVKDHYLGDEPVPNIEAVAQRLGYEPDFRQFGSSWQLEVDGPPGPARIIVSFHGVGIAFRGLIVASAFAQIADREPVALCEDVFRVSFNEDEQEVQARFKVWLEPCLVEGIALWRRTLV